MRAPASSSQPPAQSSPPVSPAGLTGFSQAVFQNPYIVKIVKFSFCFSGFFRNHILSFRILKQNTSNANGLRACLVNTI